MSTPSVISSRFAGIVVVSHPKKDLGLGLVKAIRRQAGI
jgi:predicted RNA binding protein YcfA (HicA-like mRNA interferase family)